MSKPYPCDNCNGHGCVPSGFGSTVEMCQECGGAGGALNERCDICNASGFDADDGRKCAYCDGSGYVRRAAPEIHPEDTDERRAAVVGAINAIKYALNVFAVSVAAMHDPDIGPGLVFKHDGEIFVLEIDPEEGSEYKVINALIGGNGLKANLLHLPAIER